MISTINPTLSTLAFLETSATFLLLVLYWSLYAGTKTRFLAYWMVGWSSYTVLAVLRCVSIWHGSPVVPRSVGFFALIAAVFTLASVMELVGQRWRLRYLWPVATFVLVMPWVLGEAANSLPLQYRTEAVLYSLLSVVAGLLLFSAEERGFGLYFLSGMLILRGVHAVDRPAWAHQTFGLFRTTLQSCLAVAAGIAMVILVLEANRRRTDLLNEKLRRLALITTEATQSLNIAEALDGILRNLLGSLGSRKGFIFLLDGANHGGKLVLRSSIGMGEKYRFQESSVSLQEPWVAQALQRQAPLIFYKATADPAVQGWMQAENLDMLVVVRVHNNESALGLLGIGFSAKHHLENEEGQFLANVANLLGLTVRNINLFESAATSRKQWRDIFDSIEEMVLVHAADGTVLRTNRSFANRVKIDPAALVGTKLREVLTRGAVQWSICPYCEGVAGKVDRTDPSFGGYFMTTDSAFCGSSGERLGTIHVIKDFTGSRLAENKFRDLFERGREGVFICDAEGRFLDFNESFLRMLGYDDRAEVLGADISQSLFVNPQDRHRLQTLLKDFGEVNDFEFQFRRKDGEIRTGRESSFVTRDPAGDISGYQGFLLDITEHKQAEFDIRRRNRELLALNAISGLLSQASTLEEGVTGALLKITELFGTDVGTVHLLDEATRQLKSCASIGGLDGVTGSADAFEIPAALLEQIRQTHALLLTGSALPAQLRDRYRSKNLQVQQVCVLWAKDRIVGTLMIGSRQVREYTPANLNLLAAIASQIATTIDKSLILKETRDAYDMLRQTQEQLLQSEKMAAVGQLISGVAHELNNPLTAILGYSQLLKTSESLNARNADYLEKLSKQAQRTHHIVQSLLSFSRQHKPERVAVQVNRILEDTLVLREYDMKRGGVLIHREFDPDLPFTSGDFHQLQQVFLNILNNAVDAVSETRPPHEIWLRTCRQGDRLLVEITDSGPGVKDPNRIFDPFYTTKPVGKGTGLGLSICYGIVKEHGGEIQVRNAPPRGATFTVALPLVPLVGAPHAGAAIPHQTAHALGKVLLIDSEEPVLQLEQELLEAHNVSVRMARSVREGMQVLRSESVDAVVVEVESPDQGSTWSFFSWIEQNRPELASHVIFTAADQYSGVDLIEKTQCQLLTKPFAIDTFWESVRNLLTDLAGSSKN